MIDHTNPLAVPRTAVFQKPRPRNFPNIGEKPTEVYSPRRSRGSLSRLGEDMRPGGQLLDRADRFQPDKLFALGPISPSRAAIVLPMQSLPVAIIRSMPMSKAVTRP